MVFLLLAGLSVGPWKPAPSLPLGVNQLSAVDVAGRPLAIESEAAASAAVVPAWVPGEEGPEALADVLVGVSNPGGQPPVTVQRRVGPTPIYFGPKPSGAKHHV